MERVKDHTYVISCEEARPIVINVLKFLYDLDAVTQTHVEVGLFESFQKNIFSFYNNLGTDPSPCTSAITT